MQAASGWQLCAADRLNLLNPSPTRYARLLDNPIVSVCTHMLLDATGPSHGILLPVPELWRTARFRDLHFCFPGKHTLQRLQCCCLCRTAACHLADSNERNLRVHRPANHNHLLQMASYLDCTTR